MEYNKLSNIPSTAEVAFRISRGKFNVYVAGTAKACIKYISNNYNNDHEVHEVVLDNHSCKPFADIEFVVSMNDVSLHKDTIGKILQTILDCCDIFCDIQERRAGAFN